MNQWTKKKQAAFICLAVISFFSLVGCQSSVSPNDFESHEGSDPLTPKEAIHYKQALIRCHKTGGTRIVKIAGVLRCF